jgi:hypothetical protein
MLDYLLDPELNVDSTFYRKVSVCSCFSINDTLDDRTEGDQGGRVTWQQGDRATG